MVDGNAFMRGRDEAEAERNALGFVQKLYGKSTRGYLVIWDNRTLSSRRFRASDLESAAKYAIERARESDVYFRHRTAGRTQS